MTVHCPKSVPDVTLDVARTQKNPTTNQKLGFLIPLLSTLSYHRRTSGINRYRFLRHCFDSARVGTLPHAKCGLNRFWPSRLAWGIFRISLMFCVNFFYYHYFFSCAAKYSCLGRECKCKCNVVVQTFNHVVAPRCKCATLWAYIFTFVTIIYIYIYMT